MARDLKQAQFGRILIVKPSSLGDVLHALPVLHGLRTRYPQATIDWLLATPFLSLLEGHPELNGVIAFDRARFARIGRDWRTTREFIGFLQDLRRRRYDLIIDLQGLFRSGFLTRATGAKTRIGPAESREGAGVFYTHRIPHGEPDAHAVDRLYGLSETLGFAGVPIRFSLPLPARALAFVEEVGASPRDHQVFAVAPGARWDTKRWTPDRFAETIRRVHASTNARCVLLGGKEDGELCDRIARAAGVAVLNLAGRTTLPEFAAVVQRADVVLCQDSAAAHLAVCFDRPLVCVIGPTNPLRTGPYRRPADIASARVPCSPCYLRHMRQCGHDHRCMTELSAEVVSAAVLARMDGSARVSTGGSNPVAESSGCR